MNTSLCFLLTIFAGLSTLLGIVPIFFKIKNINKFIVSSLSFASGVMFSISTFDLLIESLKMFYYENNIIITTLLFLIFFVIGFFVSKFINDKLDKYNDLYKVGITSMIAIILHNIPEGILTFTAFNVNQKLGLTLALAITLHNIPEGISIAVPIYYSTKSKIKVLIYTIVSALAEPLGAILAFLFLKNLVSNMMIGIMLSLVCGIMIYISLFELLKEAKKYNEDRLLNLFFVIGLIFMFITLHI
ncbi:MAG: ZIP family metal transporter [Bacilli bacterium]|nr:ZIP family metal transporter [Bacilli bacterium]